MSRHDRNNPAGRISNDLGCRNLMGAGMRKFLLATSGCLALAAPSAFSQSRVDLALEEFVGNDQGVASGTTTEASLDEDVSYIEIDVDGNGVNEIFISRPDLMSDSIWILYRDTLNEDGGITKIGVAELDANTMRFAERDGVKGYYELYHMGAGKSRLVFNAFDKDGMLVALSEEVMEAGGKDKALYDSLYFDSAGNKPDIKSLPVIPIRQSVLKKKTAALSKSPGERAAMPRDPAHPAVVADKVEKSLPNADLGKPEARTGWLLGGIFGLVAIAAGWWIFRIGGGRARRESAKTRLR